MGGANPLINFSHILQRQQTFGLYQSSGHFIEDPNIKANALMFQDDLAILNQYRQQEDLNLAVDPLGDISFPFMQLVSEQVEQPVLVTKNEPSTILEEK